MSKKKRNTTAKPTQRVGKGPKKATYRVRNWATYNQSLVQRGSVTLWLSEDVLENWHPAAVGPRQRGGQVQYSEQAITCMLTLRAVFKLAYRQTEGLGQSLLDWLGSDLSVPDDSTLGKRSADLALIWPTSRPEEAKPIVVDSTGLKI